MLLVPSSSISRRLLLCFKEITLAFVSIQRAHQPLDCISPSMLLFFIWSGHLLLLLVVVLYDGDWIKWKDRAARGAPAQRRQPLVAQGCQCPSFPQSQTQGSLRHISACAQIWISPKSAGVVPSVQQKKEEGRPQGFKLRALLHRLISSKGRLESTSSQIKSNTSTQSGRIFISSARHAVWHGLAQDPAKLNSARLNSSAQSTRECYLAQFSQFFGQFRVGLVCNIILHQFSHFVAGSAPIKPFYKPSSTYFSSNLVFFNQFGTQFSDYALISADSGGFG